MLYLFMDIPTGSENCYTCMKINIKFKITITSGVKIGKGKRKNTERTKNLSNVLFSVL